MMSVIGTMKIERKRDFFTHGNECILNRLSYNYERYKLYNMLPLLYTMVFMNRLKGRIICIALILSVLLSLTSPIPSSAPSPTLSPTPAPTSIATPTLTPSPTPSRDNTSIPTPTPTQTLSHASPTITLFAPSSPVLDAEDVPRTLNITTNLSINVSRLLNTTEVYNQSNVTESIYTNTSSKTGMWNVSVIASNENGTAMQTWIWNVSSQVTPTPTPTPGPTPSPSPLTTPTPAPKPSPTPAPLKILSSNVKPSTPFYIYGWVHYENGAECLKPIVNIINTNTSENWQAETSPKSNFFQLLVNNISKGDVLEFNTTDGTEYTTTTHVVNQTEVTNSGLFDFNLNLALSVPALTVNVDLTPDDDPSTPGIQIINPDQSSKNKTVTIIANVTNLNGYEDITRVIANITGPSIVAASPVSLVFVSNISATTANYNGTFYMSNHTEGEYKVEVSVTDTEGLTCVGAKIFTYLQTTRSSPAAPGIVSYAPPSPVSDYEGATRTFNISINQIVNVSWQINGTEVFNQNDVNEAAYTNTSAVIGTWNVSAIVSNSNGGDMQTWIWNVTSSPSPTPPPISTNATPSTPLYIYGYISYENGSACNAPFVVITNLNTGEELIADNMSEEPFYQLITNSAFVNASDMLRIEASKNGTPVGNTTHTVNQTEIERSAIVVDIYKGCALPDLVISQICTPTQIIENEANTINVTILNDGTRASGAFNVTLSVTKCCNETEYGNETRIHGLKLGQSENINFSWSPSSKGSYIITVFADSNREVNESNEMNNNLTRTVSVGVPEFIVTNVTFNPGEPKLGDLVWLNATIENAGTEGEAVVEFYDEKELEIGRMYSEDPNYDKCGNVTINIPDADKIRLHFSSIGIISGEGAYLRIYDENNKSVHNFTRGYNDIAKSNFWTNWSSGSTIRVESYAANDSLVAFTITGYRALLENVSISLNASDSRYYNITWNTSAYATDEPNFPIRNHTINVSADPHNEVSELNEWNNSCTKTIFVSGADLAVEKILIPCGFSHENRCSPGDVVDITATIVNKGKVDASRDFMVTFYNNYWSDSIEAEFYNKTTSNLSAGSIINITAQLDLTDAKLGENLTITVRIEPRNNTDNEETNNENSNTTKYGIGSGLDFSVENVSVYPEQVKKGETVTINATIGNLGNTNESVSVGFYVNSTDFIGSGGERFIRIGTSEVYAEAGKTNITSAITWNANVAGGNHQIVAVVDPDNEFDEISDTDIIGKNYNENNIKNCTLNITLLDLNLTMLKLDPAHPNVCDQVNVSAKIKNNETEQAISTVWFYIEENKSITIPRGGVSVGPYAKRKSLSTTISPPECLKGHIMRVHFENITIAGDKGSGDVTVYNEGISEEPIYLYAGDQQLDCLLLHTHPPKGSERRKEWTDVWTDWNNNNITIDTKVKYDEEGSTTVTLQFSIDKYQVFLDNRIVTLNAGDIEYYNITWNAPQKPGNYTILANVEDKVLRNETFVSGTDLAIMNFPLSEKTYLDGDEVNITVTIKNLGGKDADNFTVRFKDNSEDKSVIFNETNITSLEANHSIPVNVTWIARVVKGNNESHNITVELDKQDNIENNETNNVITRTVRVNMSRDFSVTNLSFWVNNTLRAINPDSGKVELVLGENATLNATLSISNLANSGGLVNVSLYYDNKELNKTQVAFGKGNGTEHAHYNWSVNVAGNHTITVKADPTNETVEFNATNNSFDQQIYVRAPDLAVTNMTFDKDSIAEGDTVNIIVEIANIGDEPADTNLTIYDCAERHIEEDGSYRYALPGEPGTSEASCIEVKRESENATAMRLYLQLDIDGGFVNIYDSRGNEIVSYTDDYYGWTPWVFGDSITVETGRSESNSAYAKVIRVNYLVPSGIIHTANYSLNVSDTKFITESWNASQGGVRCIVAKIDPEDVIIELNESNNEFSRIISVKGAELTISNLWLTVNGTEIGENDTIKHGDVVNITANITNTGIKRAENFDVSFLVDSNQIDSKINQSLSQNESLNVSTIWNATMGSHWIEVEVDYEGTIAETWKEEIYVRAAELLGNISWTPMDLNEGDNVTITANVTNSGFLPAEKFSVILATDGDDNPRHHYYNQFGDLTSADWHWVWIYNNTWEGSSRVYVHIKEQGCEYGTSYLAIYDKKGKLVANSTEPGWIEVPGDTVGLQLYVTYNTIVDIDFYAGAILRKEVSLGINQATNVSMTQKVKGGNHTVMLRIDPEGIVPENDKTDNIVSRVMHVNATRDFTVIDVRPEKTNLSDAGTLNITATVAQPKEAFRNGTTEVSFVDYEKESCTYQYRYSRSINPHYAPVSPDATTTIIRRPGVDAIKVHFKWLKVDLEGVIIVWSEHGSWYKGPTWDYETKEAHTIFDITTSWIPGDTVYITTKNAEFELEDYTTRKEFNRTEVTLNASETMNESKDITVEWAASTGEHNITTIIDPDNEIGELNESNNAFDLPLHVNASKDPTIVALNNTPQNPNDGENVTITAVVCNNGTKNASFNVDFWENTTKSFTAKSSCISVPNASWISIHLNHIWKIENYVLDPTSENDTVKIEDVWIDTLGGRIESTEKRYGDITWCTVGRIDTYDSDWYKQIDKITYRKLLNRTYVSQLAPNETREVNATWYNMSVADDPMYSVTIIIDPEDEIDEINENNNENEVEILMNYQDITVAGFKSPTRDDKNASVIIKEVGGITGVSNLTVKFWKGTEQKEELLYKEGTDIYTLSPHPGAHNIRAYFTAIKLKPGGKVKIRNKTGDIVKTYDENQYDRWTPWVKGDTILIDYTRADKIKVDRYAWGEVEYKTIDQLNASESKNVSIPSKWNKYDKYDEPRELTVTVDPDNNITELVEGNNSKTGVIYVDLVAEDLYFKQPTADKLVVLVEHNIIKATIRNNNETEGIVFPAGGEKLNFGIALEVRHPNGTVAFRHTENSNSENTNFEFPHADKMLYAGEEINVTFIEGKIYPDFVGDTKSYEVSVIADSENDIFEGNDFHSDGEENNASSKTVPVYSGSGYMGGDLYNFTHDRIYGDMVYSIGKSKYGHGDVKFTGIPSGVNITLARLYVYWVWSEDSSPGVAMAFNDVGVSPKKYSENPTATKYNKWYGTYAYDVTDIAKSGGNNEAKATIDEGVLSGMLLLVVYEDESKPLVEYWITEGAELMMAKNDQYPTGLEFDQCIANASFVGIVNETKVSKAELLTVIPSLAEETLCEGVTIGDALMFNGGDVGSPRGKSYWEYEGKGCMALTSNRWADVKEHLDTQDNLAEIQSKGNFMLATNAVFKLTYLPDLTVTLRAPSSAKGGTTHKIKATIRNTGEAKAENFKVSFTASDGTPKDEVRTIKLLEGFSDTTVEFTWTAPDIIGALEQIKTQNVTISVMADSGGKVEELEEGNNIATDYISVTMTEKPLALSRGGGGGGGGTGPGKGTEAVVDAATTAGGSGESAAVPQETKGQTITGRLMKGTVARSETAGGSGKRGEFSLVKLLIRLALLAVAVALVYVGYCHERRRHKNKQKK